MPTLKFATPRPTPSYAPRRPPMDPIQPELISPSPQTLLTAVVEMLRSRLPTFQFNIQVVTDHEAVITHHTTDGHVEFFRVKITR